MSHPNDTVRGAHAGGKRQQKKKGPGNALHLGGARKRGGGAVGMPSRIRQRKEKKIKKNTGPTLQNA